MDSQKLKELKNKLCSLIRTLAYKEGQFTLASGKESIFYVDLKNVSLHPEGAKIIGELVWCELNAHEFGGVGGPTLGADPLATAISLAALEKGASIAAFIIRKEPKKHGTSKWIEGAQNLVKSKPLLLVEDVVTTGASGLKAIEKLRAEGFNVHKALAVLDRNEGAEEAFSKEGIQLISLTNIHQITGVKK